MNNRSRSSAPKGKRPVSMNIMPFSFDNIPVVGVDESMFEPLNNTLQRLVPSCPSASSCSCHREFVMRRRKWRQTRGMVESSVRSSVTNYVIGKHRARFQQVLKSVMQCHVIPLENAPIMLSEDCELLGMCFPDAKQPARVPQSEWPAGIHNTLNCNNHVSLFDIRMLLMMMAFRLYAALLHLRSLNLFWCSSLVYVNPAAGLPYRLCTRMFDFHTTPAHESASAQFELLGTPMKRGKDSISTCLHVLPSTIAPYTTPSAPHPCTSLPPSVVYWAVVAARPKKVELPSPQPAPIAPHDPNLNNEQSPPPHNELTPLPYASLQPKVYGKRMFAIHEYILKLSSYTGLHAYYLLALGVNFPFIQDIIEGRSSANSSVSDQDQEEDHEEDQNENNNESDVLYRKLPHLHTAPHLSHVIASEGCRYRVVTQALENAGSREVQDYIDNTLSTSYCCDYTVDRSNVAQGQLAPLRVLSWLHRWGRLLSGNVQKTLNILQRCNHWSNSYVLGRKDNLVRTVSRFVRGLRLYTQTEWVVEPSMVQSNRKKSIPVLSEGTLNELVSNWSYSLKQHRIPLCGLITKAEPTANPESTANTVSNAVFAKTRMHPLLASVEDGKVTVTETDVTATHTGEWCTRPGLLAVYNGNHITYHTLPYKSYVSSHETAAAASFYLHKPVAPAGPAFTCGHTNLYIANYNNNSNSSNSSLSSTVDAESSEEESDADADDFASDIPGSHLKVIVSRARVPTNTGSREENVIFPYLPETYILPGDAEQLFAKMRAGSRGFSKSRKPLWIVKPAASSCGRGIFLVRKYGSIYGEEFVKHEQRQVEYNTGSKIDKRNIIVKQSGLSMPSNNIPSVMVDANTAVSMRGFFPPPSLKKLIVSRYVSNPFLINKRKFDMRIYVAVTSVQPLRCYVYGEGLVRFCTAEYEAPQGEDNTETKYAHLTNYSVNKHNKSFVKNLDRNTNVDSSNNNEDDGVDDNDDDDDDDDDIDDDGSAKSSNETAFNINESKWRLSQFFTYLESVGIDAAGVFANIKDLLARTVIAAQPHLLERGNPASGFELLGFDVLLDSTLKPWLMEVNLGPSLAASSPMDNNVKSHLQTDVYNMVGPVLPLQPPVPQPQIGSFVQSPPPLEHWPKECMNVVLTALSEQARSGLFTPLHPSTMSHKYIGMQGNRGVAIPEARGGSSNMTTALFRSSKPISKPKPSNNIGNCDYPLVIDQNYAHDWIQYLWSLYPPEQCLQVLEKYTTTLPSVTSCNSNASNLYTTDSSSLLCPLGLHISPITTHIFDIPPTVQRRAYSATDMFTTPVTIPQISIPLTSCVNQSNVRLNSIVRTTSVVEPGLTAPPIPATTTTNMSETVVTANMAKKNITGALKPRRVSRMTGFSLHAKTRINRVKPLYLFEPEESKGDNSITKTVESKPELPIATVLPKVQFGFDPLPATFKRQ